METVHDVLLVPGVGMAEIPQWGHTMIQYGKKGIWHHSLIHHLIEERGGRLEMESRA